ncbi:50S ribosomal protein L25/general stress protein Ctc [Leekyejoonella antrihumi]|uniref:Large ribosomal subunit protein bL25 n=1 Tax=Leekyejoonella antrihumi TaxID=1660198 RepID=A0A563E816_9MICO|nr:50S ribosomal protein L25/general stress protein Ctc [Leekyejoonella antrihumi]TWP38676.1 50S ribosomal protein L25/general stress protein Ctc [Leekyejoonella antrihumi]
MVQKELRIATDIRTEFGKGAARRIRRADKIPAVLYGHGTEPVHLTLPGHEMMMALKHSNAILTLEIEGEDQLALAKDVQRHIIKPFIEHVDLVIVRRGEKVTVDVPIHLEGEAAPGTSVYVENNEITIEADAMNIPESFTVSIEGLEVGSQILAKDVPLPTGVDLAVDEELLIVNVTEERLAEIPEDEETEAAEGETAEDQEKSADTED